jgi:hypothetical protein
MKTIVALILFCLLLPLTCVNGGKVKTVDGKQMSKDSVAVLYLCEQEGKRFADSILFVYAVKIDTVTVSEILHGVKDDYALAENANVNAADWDFDKAHYEFSEAYRARKVNLTPGKHGLTLRCLARFTSKKEDYVFFTTPFLMAMEVAAQHTYDLKILFVAPVWHITIEDKATKAVVDSVSVIARQAGL